MDRAHRLGQTRQVTVYRLICRGSIDERIVQLARRKKDVQDMVVGNKSFSEMNQTNEMVQLLLTDEQIAAAANAPVPERPVGQFSGAGMAGLRDLWVEEGDEFFGASNIQPMADDEGTPAPTTGRGRGRGRPRGSGEGRGRGRGGRGRGERGGRGRGGARGERLDRHSATGKTCVVRLSLIALYLTILQRHRKEGQPGLGCRRGHSRAQRRGKRRRRCRRRCLGRARRRRGRGRSLGDRRGARRRCRRAGRGRCQG